MTDVMLTRVDHLRSGRTPFVLATVVRAERPTSAKPGDRALVLPDGSIEGFVGGQCAESTVRLQGLRLLRTGESTLLRITPEVESETVTEGLVTVGNPCLSGGSLDIFLEAMLPPTLVHVYGSAPVARALVEVGGALGYDVRPGLPAESLPPDLTAVIVASHGHDEEAILTAALNAEIPYIALVASPRRGAAVLAALPVPGDRVHTPAGLDIGARTAPEIAVSIYAELIASHHPPVLPRDPLPAAAVEAVDPVCGMTVPITDSTLSLSHHYFCGPGCHEAFADDPSRYVVDWRT